MNTPQAPPGWYDDPSRPNEKRWWDGGQWTEHFRPAPNGVFADWLPPQPYLPPPPPAVPTPNARQVDPGVAINSIWRSCSKAFRDRLWVKIATGFAVLVLLAGLFGDEEGDKSQPAKVAPAAVAKQSQLAEAGPSEAELRKRKKKQVAKVVEAYYAALNREDFDAAWRRLSSDVRQDLDGFESWRDGYSTTVKTSPSSLRVTSVSGNSAVATMKLSARDEDVCGDTVPSRYAGTWKLRRVDRRWVATDVKMRKISGRSLKTDPADCEVEPDYEPASPDDSSGDGCNSNYEGACIPDSPGDIDCPDVPESNFDSVGSDPYRFDADGDGVACES